MNPETMQYWGELAKTLGIPGFCLIFIIAAMKPFLVDMNKEMVQQSKHIAAQNEILRGLQNSLQSILHEIKTGIPITRGKTDE